MKQIFIMSDKGKSEYCCNVVRIGEVVPIEGSDFLAKTVINGDSIVIRKDEVKEGDLMFYASNETQLNLDFLSANNLFELSSRELNANHKEVERLMDEGKKDEWNILEVRDFTNKLISENPEIAEWLQPITILYHGTLRDLYPDIPVSEHWHQGVLAAMQNDKEHFCMELYEPLCNIKVPREGIVLRIDDDPVNEAFKLKTVKFREKEKSLIDNGEVDMEMMDTYVS